MVAALRPGLVGLSLLALTTGLTGPVQAAQASAPAPVWAVRTPQGPLKAALLALGRQTGVQIIFTSRAVEGRQAPALDGQFSLDEALGRLLAGSDLEAQRAAPTVLVIRPRASLTPASATAPSAPDLLASLTADPALATPSVQATDTTMLSEIVVGSHIRGVKDSASPVVVLSRDEMTLAGIFDPFERRLGGMIWAPSSSVSAPNLARDRALRRAGRRHDGGLREDGARIAMALRPASATWPAWSATPIAGPSPGPWPEDVSDRTRTPRSPRDRPALLPEGP